MKKINLRKTFKMKTENYWHCKMILNKNILVFNKSTVNFKIWKRKMNNQKKRCNKLKINWKNLIRKKDQEMTIDYLIQKMKNELKRLFVGINFSEKYFNILKLKMKSILLLLKLFWDINYFIMQSKTPRYLLN